MARMLQRDEKGQCRQIYGDRRQETEPLWEQHHHLLDLVQNRLPAEGVESEAKEW